MGRELGLAPNAIFLRIKRLGLTRGEAREGGPRPPSAEQTRAHRDARRGFAVPAEAEDRYVEILKQGVSIAEARRQLGIEK